MLEQSLKGVPPGTPVEIWFQDEARVGQKNGQVYQWAPKGTGPRQVADQRYENAYIFRAVCPALDKGAALVMPNAEAMPKNLEEISQSIAANAHGVVIMDRAGWHRSGALKIPENLSILFLPPYSPEIEPDRENLAIPAPNLPLKPGIRNLGGHRRCMLRRLEPPDRRNWAQQINRNAKLS